MKNIEQIQKVQGIKKETTIIKRKMKNIKRIQKIQKIQKNTKKLLFVKKRAWFLTSTQQPTLLNIYLFVFLQYFVPIFNALHINLTSFLRFSFYLSNKIRHNKF